MTQFDPHLFSTPCGKKISPPPPRLSTPPPKEKFRPPHLLLDNSNTVTKLSPNWACQMGPIHCPKCLLSGLPLSRKNFPFSSAKISDDHFFKHRPQISLF